MSLRLIIVSSILWMLLGGYSCETVRPKHLLGVVRLPNLRSTSEECYYIDEFLPTPDHLVTGRSGGMYIRYYTYRKALYKFWTDQEIELSFYSKDGECYSLFAENVIPVP